MSQTVIESPRANPYFSEALKFFRVLLLVALALRVLYAAMLQLAPDEAFYWVWSRHLALGYFDHPPLIAYLIWLGTHVLGSNELGVRIIGALMSVGAMAVIVWLAGRVSGEVRATAWVALVWLTSPLMAILGVVFTPDTPAVFFSVCGLAFAVLIAQRIDHDDRQSRVLLWIGFGVFSGLGLLSKYPAVLLPTGVCFAFLFSPEGIGEFKRPWIYLSGILAVAIFSPVIWWNAHHQWASFLFQINHGTSADEGSPTSLSAGGRAVLFFKDLGNYLGGQALVWTPILFGIAIIVLVRYWARYRRIGQVDRVLLWTGTLPLVLFGVACVVSHHTEVNWPAFAYFPLSILSAKWLAETWSEARSDWARIAWQVGLGFTIVIHVLFIPAVIRRLEHTSLRLPHLMTDLTEWRRRGAILGRQASQTGSVVITNRHEDAGEAAFYVPGQPDVWCIGIGSRPTAFDYFDEPPDFAKIPRVLWLGGHVDLFEKKYGYREVERFTVTFPDLNRHRTMTTILLTRK